MNNCLYNVKDKCIKDTLSFDLCNSCIYRELNRILDGMVKLKMEHINGTTGTNA